MAVGTMIQTISGSTDVTSLQAAINQQFAQLMNVPLINGQQVMQVPLVTGKANQIPHKLGRKAVGYIVTSVSAGALIWNDSFNDKFVPLYASAACTVDLWVF